MQFPILTFIQSLNPSDLGWIDAHAEILNLVPGEILIREGSYNSDLYIVESGLLSVFTGDITNRDTAEQQEIARIGPGSLVGDLSWVDLQITSASVKAAERSLVLRLEGNLLEEKIAEDDQFAARFLRGIARLIAERLRETNRALMRSTANANKIATDSEPAKRLLDRLEVFKTELLEMDEQLIASPGEQDDDTFGALQSAFHAMLVEFNSLMATDLSEQTRTEIGAIFRRELLPYLSLTSAAERLYSKPRGYAGDYHAIELIYQNEAAGHGRIGPLMDRCFLDEPVAKALRNRRQLIGAEIRASLASSAGDIAVTSLSCGSAQEVLDIFNEDQHIHINFTGVDIDNEAIECVNRWADAKQLSAHVKAIHGNLIYIAAGKQELNLHPQDLIYGIGFIDYFNDSFAINILNWIHAQLAPGGRVLLENFHASNPDKAFMDHVLDWHLIHRTEEEVNRLFAASKFGRSCDRLFFEEEGVMLFAEAIKR